MSDRYNHLPSITLSALCVERGISTCKGSMPATNEELIHRLLEDDDRRAQIQPHNLNREAALEAEIARLRSLQDVIGVLLLSAIADASGYHPRGDVMKRINDLCDLRADEVQAEIRRCADLVGWPLLEDGTLAGECE